MASSFSYFSVLFLRSQVDDPKNKKAPTFQSRLPCFFPLIIKRWFQSCDLHTLCLTNRFVCNFLSSSAGFNLCSCFFRLTLPFRFHISASASLFSRHDLPRPIAAFSQDSLCSISTIIKLWLQPFGLHTRSLTIGIVCNFLSSSARFNLCSCFFWLTLAFYFRFWLLWAVRSAAHHRFPSAF